MGFGKAFGFELYAFGLFGVQGWGYLGRGTFFWLRKRIKAPVSSARMFVAFFLRGGEEVMMVMIVEWVQYFFLSRNIFIYFKSFTLFFFRPLSQNRGVCQGAFSPRQCWRLGPSWMPHSPPIFEQSPGCNDDIIAQWKVFNMAWRRLWWLEKDFQHLLLHVSVPISASNQKSRKIVHFLCTTNPKINHPFWLYGGWFFIFKIWGWRIFPPPDTNTTWQNAFLGIFHWHPVWSSDLYWPPLPPTHCEMRVMWTSESQAATALEKTSRGVCGWGWGSMGFVSKEIEDRPSFISFFVFFALALWLLFLRSSLLGGKFFLTRLSNMSESIWECERVSTKNPDQIVALFMHEKRRSVDIPIYWSSSCPTCSCRRARGHSCLRFLSTASHPPSSSPPLLLRICIYILPPVHPTSISILLIPITIFYSPFSHPHPHGRPAPIHSFLNIRVLHLPISSPPQRAHSTVCDQYDLITNVFYF